MKDLRQKKLFNSSSGSCHGSDVTWQEDGRTYDNYIITGQNLRCRIESLIEVVDGLRKQCTPESRDGVL